ncbi:MAG: RNHCP domain-containing protein [bacterium]|nr:RNHCP domain-containing protein [bacterium]
MGFITVNEGFNCELCGAKVPPAKGTCRNHCTKCLASKHVDDHIPGDRAAMCRGLMEAISAEGTELDKVVISHQCEICGKVQRNKVSSDDNRDVILKLMKLTQL